MNKKYILSLLVLAFGANIEAIVKQKQTAIVTKPQEPLLTDEKPLLTMEEKHEVLPINVRQAQARQVICEDIKNTVFKAFNALVEKSNGNLTIAAPQTQLTAPRLAMFTNPETGEQLAIHYTPHKPVTLIGQKEEFIHKLENLLHELSKRFEHCGLQFKTAPAGTQQAPQNWLAWYQTKLGVMGAPRMFLVLEQVPPTLEQIKAVEGNGNKAIKN